MGTSSRSLLSIYVHEDNAGVLQVAYSMTMLHAKCSLNDHLVLSAIHAPYITIMLAVGVS